MTDYIVSGADLTAVANEIRSKGGTSAQLEFPTEFISAIEAISGGGAKNILSGTTVPTSADGSDGDIWLLYDKVPILPSGYTPVEYIENTATGAYVDTGYMFVANSKIDIKVNMSSGSSSYPSPFGVRTGTSGRGVNQWHFSMSGTGVYYAMGNDERNTSNSWVYGEDNRIVAQAGTAEISGGINKTINTNAQSGIGTYPVMLFAVNLNGAPWSSTWAIMKLYHCKIYEGDTLVHDYVPAINASDVAGLYDIVGDEFLINAGSGSFIAGEELVVDYILTAYLKVNGSWLPLIGQDIDDVSTEGGGGGVPLFTQAEWNTLTTAQKKTYGLVAIQKANSGYNRGLLVNGADYTEVYTYLPRSDESKVDCLAIYENFTASALSWGSGLSPVMLASAVSQYNDEQAVYLNARSGCQPKIELPTTTSDFTMYVVAKGIAYNSGDMHIMGSVGTWTTGKIINIYHRSGTMWRSSTYGSGDQDLIDTGGDYVAVAIRSATGSGNLLASWFAHNGSSRLNATYSNHGNYFTFGWRDGANGVDLAVKFVGYVNEAETDAQITANLANLATIFELS